MTMAWALRNLILRSPDEQQGNGGDSQSGDGDNGDDQQNGDANADVSAMDATTLKTALIAERELRKTKEREAKTLLREKEAREKKDRETQDEAARKNGEWEKLAKDAEAARDAEIAKREALERQVIEDRKKNAVLFEAQKLSFHDPEEAVRLLDLDKIEVDDDQKPVGVLQAVKKLADTKKHLVKTGGSDGMPQTPTRQGDNSQYNAARAYAQQVYGNRKNA